MDTTSAPKPPSALSEREYLDQQCTMARQALSATMSQLRSDAVKVADPRAWARRYPWVTVGATAAAGFATAYALMPSREDQALKKLARIEQALRSKTSREDEPDTDEKEPEGFGKMMTRQLIGVIRPALVSLISAGLSAKVATAHDDANEDPGSAASDDPL